MPETGVEADNRAENRHGNPGYNDGIDAGAQPYDKKRRESGFRKTVQHHKVRLGNLRKRFGIPQSRGGKDGNYGDKQKTEQCFQQCDSGMGEERAVKYHL